MTEIAPSLDTLLMEHFILCKELGSILNMKPDFCDLIFLSPKLKIIQS
jgi:hypothetical protein